MTKYVGERIKHLHRNYVIDVSSVDDKMVRRLLKDPRVIRTTTEYLKGIDGRYELRTPLDGTLEGHLKDIQRALGREFKLQALREDYPILYDRLRKYGKPTHLLNSNGFEVETGNTRLSRRVIRARLWSLVKDKESRQVVGLERRSPSTYNAIRRLSKENGMTVKEYVENVLGFKYGK